MKRTRVWFVSELFYPEMTSTGSVLTYLAEALAGSYEIFVLCAQPTYSNRGMRAASQEMHNGVRIYRSAGSTFDKDKLALRLVNLITISVMLFCSALRRFRRGDVVVVVTNPPSLPYLIRVAAWVRGALFVLRVEDVYPEVLSRLGMLSDRSLAMRLMHWASAKLYNSADYIVVLGRDMLNLIAPKLKAKAAQTAFIPNWGSTDQILPREAADSALRDRLCLRDKFVVQYSGNIGRTHGIEDIVAAAELLRSQDDFSFLVIGWGAKKAWAQREQQTRELRNLLILEPQPLAHLADSLSAADIAIISFSPHMSGISIPSRMYNVMAAGRPILAVCDDNSELAMVVREENIGWVVAPGHPEQIVAVLLQARDSPPLLKEMGSRARRAAESRYTLAHVLSRYKEVIDGLVAAECSGR